MLDDEKCLCGSGRLYSMCCKPFSGQGIENYKKEIDSKNYIKAYYVAVAMLSDYLEDVRKHTNRILKDNPVIGRFVLHKDVNALSELADRIFHCIPKGNTDNWGERFEFIKGLVDAEDWKNECEYYQLLYYELNNDDWKLHIGANVDLSFGFDKSFRISPDITAQYIFSDSYIVYAKATGGKQLNDFRRLESICPYGELPEANTTATLGYVQRPYDTYEQINGSIGFKASPYPGLWFNVFGGYQNLKNDLSYLGFDPSNIHSGSYLSFAQDNTDNLYLGGEISYDYKDILGISAKYTYRNWDSKTEEYLLAVKPVSEMSFNVRIHPISALNINLGYDYINRKEVKEYAKMTAVNDLHIGASYNVFKGVSVYAQVHNLLNKKYQYYLGYPAEGFNFLGGLSFRF